VVQKGWDDGRSSFGVVQPMVRWVCDLGVPLCLGERGEIVDGFLLLAVAHSWFAGMFLWDCAWGSDLLFGDGGQRVLSVRLATDFFG